MSSQRIIVMGGPDAGKTNYVGRLWMALRDGSGALKAFGIPTQVEYIEQVVDYLYRGQFAPRTEQGDFEPRHVSLPFVATDGNDASAMTILIPDVSGELWRKAVETRRIRKAWMAHLESASGALIFVRVQSADNSTPIDWVNAAELMPYGKPAESDLTKVPTQVMLCEFLRLVETGLLEATNSEKPRIGVIVSAWDLLDAETAANTPRSYLEKEYPLFVGRLDDISDRFEVVVFGISILGGDLEDGDFRTRLLEGAFDSAGFVLYENSGRIKREGDVTVPVSWLAGIENIS